MTSCMAVGGVTRARWRGRSVRLAISGSCLIAASLNVRETSAQMKAPPYAGKQIRLVVGSGAGGGVDVYARTLAVHLSDHILGHPAIVVENMPGAIGRVAMNWAYNSAPRDGTAILSSSNVALAAPLFGDPGAKYDPRKLVSIGSISSQQSICATWGASSVKTIDEAKQKTVVVAADAPGSQSATLPMVLNAMLGTKFKVVTGYATSDVGMALERGEAEGVCGLSWSTLKASHPQWIADRRLNVLAQTGSTASPDLPDAPVLLDLTSNPEDQQILRVLEFPGQLGRPFLMPPGTPNNLVEIVRSAFDATMKDPSFLADAKKARLDVDPIAGKAMAEIIASAYATPPDLLTKAAPFSGFSNH